MHSNTKIKIYILIKWIYMNELFSHIKIKDVNL